MRSSGLSRQNIYVLISSLVLLIMVLLFSFLVLIPKGKEYRIKRSEMIKVKKEAYRYEKFNNDTLSLLKKLQGANRYTITALSTPFSEDRFLKQHKKYFKTLNLSKRVLKLSFPKTLRQFSVLILNLVSNEPNVYLFVLLCCNK